jgi:pimeloyl-ACP methyl ester carboxylesterase
VPAAPARAPSSTASAAACPNARSSRTDLILQVAELGWDRWRDTWLLLAHAIALNGRATVLSEPGRPGENGWPGAATPMLALDHETLHATWLTRPRPARHCALEEAVMRGTAVLVHGLWASPADFRWVAERLRDNDVEVVVSDLPSHRTSSAGLTADAADVRHAIAAARPPVVAVGWSYGCEVIHEAAAGEPSVTHLVYIAGIPNPDPGVFPPAGSEAEDDRHILVFNDGTFVLDNDWWLSEEAGTTMPGHIQAHLREHPRRPASSATWTDPVTAAAWDSIPVTFLIGRFDDLVPSDRVEWAERHFEVRIVDSDHFIIFREPGFVADVVIEKLDDARRSGMTSDGSREPA